MYFEQFNIMAFFKFLFFLIASFYLLGFIGKLFFRWWLLKKQKEFQQNRGSASGPFYSRTYTWGAGNNNRSQDQDSRSRSSKEGEIHVDKTIQNHKKVNSKVGDYVDFEEIKTK